MEYLDEMEDFDRYKYLLGETVIYYQFMENDLKLIYAGLLPGNFAKNIEFVRSSFKGLGQIVLALEELDFSSGDTPYFTRDTYKLLSKIARQRNFYCHQCCLDFCFNPYFKDSIEFKDSLDSLIKTNNSIRLIQSQTEKYRKAVLDKFN